MAELGLLPKILATHTLSAESLEPDPGPPLCHQAQYYLPPPLRHVGLLLTIHCANALLWGLNSGLHRRPGKLKNLPKSSQQIRAVLELPWLPDREQIRAGTQELSPGLLKATGWSA